MPLNTSAIQRNQAIDLLKIIAMLGVISLHCNMDRLDNPVAFVLSRIAGISVPLFFMVSGFLLIEKDGSWRYSIRKIWGIVRFVFICSFIFWLVHVIHHRQIDILLFQVLFNSFIQKGPFWMFWYFGAMCLLYILLPLIKWGDKHIDHFLPKMILLLVCLDFIVFIMTFSFRWEYSVIQSFRIWNWLTYFSFGAIIHKYQVIDRRITPLVVVSMLLFVGFVYFCQSAIDGIEYFFTSPLCMIYASLLFILVVSHQIIHNRYITLLSDLFLPVYTTHYFVIKAWHWAVDAQYAGLVTPLVDFLAISLLSLSLSFIIMRVPLSKQIFRI